MHLLPLYPEPGNKGNSLSRNVQTSLAPACHWSSRGSPPSWTWMSGTSLHVGVQEASQESSCPQGWPTHLPEESHFGTDPPPNLTFHLSLTSDQDPKLLGLLSLTFVENHGLGLCADSHPSHSPLSCFHSEASKQLIVARVFAECVCRKKKYFIQSGSLEDCCEFCFLWWPTRGFMSTWVACQCYSSIKKHVMFNSTQPHKAQLPNL